MPIAFQLPKSRFRWSALRGRCRVRILVGLAVLLLALAYTSYAGQRFGHRGYDDRGFDTPIVRLAHTFTPPPRHMRDMTAENERELYLITVISDQQDVVFGLTAFLLRMVVSTTIAGFGLILLTAGSTEWEIRSEA